ncbi:unnamed protein product [Cylicocyclus nassatus]|uniref:Uncharacterized protein n=1 Tax=Cylicocyclus nassatus TaxID=53992 RepID=A0AA36MBW6_CYLNA|nr:unnamed protein product [Cylicocyclus nassatus]
MSKMRLVLLSVALLAVASASPAIFSEERIEAMLEKLRRAKATGEYAVNTPTGIYPIRSITKENIRQIFNFGLGSQKFGETIDEKAGEAETKISESKDDVVGTLKKEEISEIDAENATVITKAEEQKPTNESTLVEEVKTEEGTEKKAEEGTEKKAEEGGEKVSAEQRGENITAEEGKEKIAEQEGELAKEKVEEKKAEETNVIEEEGKPAEGRLGGGPSIEGFSEPKSAEGQPEGKTSEIQKEKSSEEQSSIKPIEGQAAEGTVEHEGSGSTTKAEELTQTTGAEAKQPSESAAETTTGSTSEVLAEGLSTITAIETKVTTETPESEAAAKEGGSGTEEEAKVVDAQVAQVAENITTGELILDEGKAAGTITEVVAETTAEGEKKEPAESSSSTETGTAVNQQSAATFAQPVAGEAPKEVEHKESAEGSAEAPEGTAEGSAAEERASVPSETSTLLTGTESPSNEITIAAESTTSPQAA